MADPEFLKYLASLGVGGIIAGLMFMFYRRDVATYTAQWKGQSEQLTKVVVDNTAAITSNTEVMRSLKEEFQLMTSGMEPAPPSGIERRLTQRPR